MELALHLPLICKYLLLFAWVLAEQLGIPLPSVPVLLAAGALSAERHFSFLLALTAAIAAGASMARVCCGC
jgi:membrane protein DedA with SNARE-associated domain